MDADLFSFEAEKDQKLVIEKLKREMFGPRAERTSRLLDQMEFELEEVAPTESPFLLVLLGILLVAGGIYLIADAIS